MNASYNQSQLFCQSAGQYTHLPKSKNDIISIALFQVDHPDGLSHFWIDRNFNFSQTEIDSQVYIPEEHIIVYFDSFTHSDHAGSMTHSMIG